MGAGTVARAAPDDALSRSVERFLYREARLLDEQRFDDWLALFDPHGTYWVPASWRQPDPVGHVSLFFEDRNLLQVRINRLHHRATATMQPPSRTLHHVSNVLVDDDRDAAGRVVVGSALLVVDHRLDDQRLFAARCRHVLAADGADWRIWAKRVDLLDCDRATGHLRINIPF